MASGTSGTVANPGKELTQVRTDIGQPRLRSLKAVQRRVNSKLRASQVGQFMQVSVYETPTGGVTLHWRLDEEALAQKERLDGRYLLVTNDWSLSHQQMFQLYRDKDGGEKRFHISKNDLKVAPIYLHQDQRIAAMLLLNMLALARLQPARTTNASAGSATHHPSTHSQTRTTRPHRNSLSRWQPPLSSHAHLPRMPAHPPARLRRPQRTCARALPRPINPPSA